MGGCPTLWGDSTDLALPFSGIVVSVATELEVGVDPDDPRDTIEPDADRAAHPRRTGATASTRRSSSSCVDVQRP